MLLPGLGSMDSPLAGGRGKPNMARCVHGFGGAPADRGPSLGMTLATYRTPLQVWFPTLVVCCHTVPKLSQQYESRVSVEPLGRRR